MIEELLIKRAEECFNEFKQLYYQDDFISTKKYNSFLDKYDDIFKINMNKFHKEDHSIFEKIKIISEQGYSTIDLRNKIYIKNKLVEEEKYFNHMFDDVNPEISLDEEQRKAVLIDEDYSLIVAGAGSGKTTTMAAKVKYLVEKKKIPCEQIIVLSFTNKATNELKSIINDDFGIDVEIKTFHKLGMDFLRKLYANNKLQIVRENNIISIISKYVRDVVFPDKKKLKDFIIAFNKYVSFDDNVFKYKSYDEYFQNYVDRKYEICKNDIKNENKRRIKNRLKYNKTIDGKYVASQGEVMIANYLYRNSIPYEYEKVFPYHVGNLRSYSPDFTIFNNDDPIYLEFYGPAKFTNNHSIECSDPIYKNNILKKRKTHNHFQTNYIELFGRYKNNWGYMQELSKQLNNFNVLKTKKTDKEIFYKIMETSKDSLYFYFLIVIKQFIGKFKELNFQKSDFKKLIENTSDKTIKAQLVFAEEIYNYYQQTIHSNHQIDFQDMINLSYKNMEKIKNKMPNLKYKYIMIDEYQDISKQRYSFTKKISDLFDAKIVAVGDDWQAIYSFSGSDVKLFTNFCNLMGYAETVKITKTYRNCQELIDLAGEFVNNSGNLIEKSLHSNKHLMHPVVLKKYNLENNDIGKVLKEILAEINKEHKKQNILLLGRYNSDIDAILDYNIFRKGMDNRIYCSQFPYLTIDFLTIHKSKGLGYDQVILLNAIDDLKGFPSKVKNPELLTLLSSNNSDEEKYSEERRLFYVALTRTKNKVYILCPDKSNQKSTFIKEIETHSSVITEP